MTRRIVEIKQTNSCYFEKAVFYCRPDIPKGTSEYTLTMEAQRIIDKLCADTKFQLKRSRKRRFFGILKPALWTTAGAAAATVIFTLFH